MPSTKHRINLTVSDEVYARIKAFMVENGIQNDATACLQMVVQRLNAYENSKVVLNTMRNLTPEQLQAIASEGIAVVKAEIDK